MADQQTILWSDMEIYMKFLCSLIIFLIMPITSMAQNESQNIIKNYYYWFNSSQLNKLEELIDNNIMYEVNFKKSVGKKNFMKFISENKKYYNEHVDNYILMVSKDRECVATKIKVSGEYLQVDDSFIPAHGEHYTLDAFNYFEIKNNKIVKASAFYDEENWKKQVSS